MNSRVTRSFREAFKVLPAVSKSGQEKHIDYGVRIHSYQVSALNALAMKFPFALAVIIVL